MNSCGCVPKKICKNKLMTRSSPLAMLHQTLPCCCCCSVTKPRLTLCEPMDCSTPPSPASTVYQSVLKFMSIESVMLSNYLILCHPLLFLLSIFPTIRVFSSESVLHIRPKYWSLSISPSNKYSWLISFRIECFDLLAVQGILRCLLQHQNSKASIFQCSAFFMVQL